ncbi:MAG: hypothetical protein AAFY72_12450 [Cyanobacteria bacterium J06649_4]
MTRSYAQRDALTNDEASRFSLSLEYLQYLAPLLERSQQPDNLCGPYWVALLLQAFGGLSVSAVEVAIAASTHLPAHGNPADWLPPGAHSLKGENYEKIPTLLETDLCGTSIAGLIQATELLSAEQFCLLPLQTPDWQNGINSLWSLCQTHPNWQIVPLLNSHTYYFWGSQLSPAAVLSYLATGKLSPPPSDWSVGHFALLFGCMTGKAANLYAVLDTYLQFGWEGLHYQSGDAIAHSLTRPQHTTTGGIALFIPTQYRTEITQAVTAANFTTQPWNNGSPEP